MSPAPSRTGVGVVAILATGALLAPAAQAGVVETPNACKFSYDQQYRTQGVEVTAAAPASVATGQRFTLTGQELEVKLRQELASDAAQVGLIPAAPEGVTSTIVTRTWFALRGVNTREGTQVIGPITIPATTTAYSDPGGGATTATPFVYTPPKLPDTTWTATGGNVTFSQAGAGAINGAVGPLPVGGGGSPMTVAGSTVVQANLPDGVNFFMDCQPGQTNIDPDRVTAGAGRTFTAGSASPFATVAVAGAPSNPGGTPDPAVVAKAKAAAATATPGRISSTRLRGRGGRVKLRVSCAGRKVACKGSIRIRTRTPQRIGRRKPKLVTIIRATPYTVAAGRAKTFTVKLGVDAKRLLRKKATQQVTVTLKPAKGKAATKKLTLKR